MNLSAHQIGTDAALFASTIVEAQFKEREGKATAHNLQKLFPENLFKNEYGYFYMQNFVVGAIISYHDMLREQLLNKGIDIGDFIESPDAPADKP